MSKIALPVAELKTALTGFGKVISKRVTLPVLNHLKIEHTSDGVISLTATDLDHFLTLRLEQPSEGEPTSLLVPCDELVRITKACGKDDHILVSRGSDQSFLLEYPIGSQVAAARVESLPVEEFPPIPEITGEAIAVPDPLRHSIEQALQCASSDETRLVLNGAYLDVSDPKGHHVVATDGRHLYSSNSFRLALPHSVILPSHSFLGWKPFLQNGGWSLRVKAEDKDAAPQVEIASTHWRFLARVSEGNYPNWRQVIPARSSAQTGVEIEAGALPTLLGLLERLPEHDSLNHSLGLEIAQGRLALLARSAPAEPWSPFVVEGASVSGKPCTVFLNRRFFSKALRFGLCRVDLIDALSPLCFGDGEGRQMIVMPVRNDSSPQAGARTPAAEVSTPPATEAPSTAPTIHSPPQAEEQPPTEERKHNPMAERTNTHLNNSNGTSASRHMGTAGTAANAHGSGAPQPAAPSDGAARPALEAAIAQAEAVKSGFREAISGLTRLSELLRQAQREEKATQKEIQGVRQTLRSLQSVRI